MKRFGEMNDEELLIAAQELKQQRDELLAAAEPALVALEKSTQFSLGVPSFEFASAKLRAAIAKVKP